MGVCPCSQKREGPVLAEDVTTSPPDDPGLMTIKLTVLIMGARGVRRGDWFPGEGGSDCYCTLKIAGREDIIHKTGELQHETVDPVWNEEVEIPDFPVGECLELDVWDSVPSDMKVPEGSTSRLVGRLMIPCNTIEPAGFNGELPLKNLGKGVNAAYLNVKMKADALEYPDTLDPEFAATLTRDPKSSLGIDMDTQDDEMVYIADVKPGPVQFYNLNVKPSEQVNPGLFVLQANGVTGVSTHIVDVLKMDRKLDLVLRRSMEMTVAIRKIERKAPLGMEFLPKVSGNNLMIIDITDGPVFEWNLTNPDMEIRCGDRITAVNGIRGRASDLLKKMKSLERFQMTIVRPVPG
mmetsp:Transcript_31603/g.90691  ORF Transcript_31603/g.90691 Transcript_31603/m.90691 type:complete len:350 (-) Transcript_31603:216-1265(-)